LDIIFDETHLIQVKVFCDVTPCSAVVRYQCFRCTCCLHLHFTLKWRQHGPLKC